MSQGLSRREFLQILKASGISIAVHTLLGGCAPAPTPGPTATPSPTPKTGVTPGPLQEPAAWEIRKKMANDPLRPQYHFLPPHNWMNDPNGVIQWEGQYHLFYQYNPEEAAWGQIHWGHAVSDNLVHWQDLPIALAPTTGGPDQNGCWSGCAVNDDGTPTLVYTGASYTVPLENYQGGPDAQQTVCLATSQDGLISWQKHPNNPVIAEPPEDSVTEGYRDPYLWREGDTWYAVIGSGIKGQGAAAMLARSTDLQHWEHLDPLFVGNSSQHGMMLECPSFFSLGDKHALVGGLNGRAYYLVGDYTDHSFTPEQEGLLDYGGYYSPQVMVDEQGRRILFAWSWEGGWTWPDRHNEKLKSQGWAGVSPLPRVLSLAADNNLLCQPVPELSVLRGEYTHLGDISVEDDQVDLPIQGNCLEIVAELNPSTAKRCGLRLCCAADDSQQVIVAYVNRSLIVFPKPASRFGLSLIWPPTPYTAPLRLAENERLKLHIFLDRSILQVFANDRIAITARCYPDPESTGIELFAGGGQAQLESLDAWQMNPIWPGTV
ncbi:MAG: glycoside hydrolase family 32 protein [Anaerolineales bacterium]|jgi:beta-fructofuranosidase